MRFQVAIDSDRVKMLVNRQILRELEPRFVSNDDSRKKIDEKKFYLMFKVGSQLIREKRKVLRRMAKLSHKKAP